LLEDLIRNLSSSAIEVNGKNSKLAGRKQYRRSRTASSRSLQQSDASNIINQITSPEEAMKLSKLIKISQPFTISKEEALETIINDRLSINQYYSLVQKIKQSKNMTFPPHYQVQ
jgi:hypothetical protein